MIVWSLLRASAIYLPKGADYQAEKVDARGQPVSAAPLAWTDAAVLLTLVAQAHRLPVVPIPGTRHRTRLAENVAATATVLTDDENAALAGIYEQVAGHRLAGLNFTTAGATA